MMFRRLINVLLLTAVAIAPNAATASENTLERIKHEGVIHTGTEPAYEPMEYIEKGETVGYDIDLLNEIAKRMGVKVDRHDMDFSALLPSLIAHKIDMVATTLSPTPERAKKVLFTAPVTDMTTVIITGNDNNDIKGRDDLQRHIVGVQQNSAYAAYITKLDEELKQRTGKGIKGITYFQSYPEILLAIKNRTIDATIAPRPVAASYIKKNPGQVKIAGLWSSEANDNSVWAVRLDDQALQSEINGQLAALEKDGTLKALQEKWFGKRVGASKNGVYTNH